MCNACAKPLAEMLTDPVGLTKTLVGAPAGDDGHLSTASVPAFSPPHLFTAILVYSLVDNCMSSALRALGKRGSVNTC